MAGCQFCGDLDARLYAAGLACRRHTPATGARRPEPPTPDPTRTVEALRGRGTR